MELLDMSVGLSGELLIQQEVLLPEKFNLSLGLSLLLLNRLRVGSHPLTKPPMPGC